MRKHGERGGGSSFIIQGPREEGLHRTGEYWWEATHRNLSSGGRGRVWGSGKRRGLKPSFFCLKGRGVKPRKKCRTKFRKDIFEDKKNRSTASSYFSGKETITSETASEEVKGNLRSGSGKIRVFFHGRKKSQMVRTRGGRGVDVTKSMGKGIVAFGKRKPEGVFCSDFFEGSGQSQRKPEGKT